MRASRRPSELPRSGRVWVRSTGHPVQVKTRVTGRRLTFGPNHARNRRVSRRQVSYTFGRPPPLCPINPATPSWARSTADRRFSSGRRFYRRRAQTRSLFQVRPTGQEAQRVAFLFLVVLLSRPEAWAASTPRPNRDAIWRRGLRASRVCSEVGCTIATSRRLVPQTGSISRFESAAHSGLSSSPHRARVGERTPVGRTLRRPTQGSQLGPFDLSSRV
jgi:hypothetical protein